ncbi:MAG: Holliday junction resolvase RuvX [Simkaniaceae bacterium]|nr:Holliday junction resolvase RuvX [Simkaniaceae bacterium]
MSERSGRILAVDYGVRRIGLALSDPGKTVGFPLTTIRAGKDMRETVRLLSEAVRDYTIETIVIGLPLHLSGKESELSEIVRSFAGTLAEAYSAPLLFWDERLTSKQAERLLIEGGVKRKKRGRYVDNISASLILQSYLDSPRPPC